jgi:hypothetical protein
VVFTKEPHVLLAAVFHCTWYALAPFTTDQPACAVVVEGTIEILAGAPQPPWVVVVNEVVMYAETTPLHTAATRTL